MTFQKIAGGDNPQFERSFADLAYAHLKDKAPKLLDFMIGFQVLDKNEDETRAAGIFGFEVGKQWFYAPVFFMNGELKGTELLYIKEQDAFVPLQENWVNYLISRKPAVTGGGTPFNESELGVISPNFRVYARSPLRGWDKTAGFCGGDGPCTYETTSGVKAAGYWYTGKLFDVFPALPCFTISPNHKVYKEAAARMDLNKVFPSLGVKAAKWVVAQIKAEPKFAQALGKFYNGAQLLDKVMNVKQADVTGSTVTPVTDGELAQNGLDRSLWKYYTTKLAAKGAAGASGTDKVVLRILADHGVKSAEHLKSSLDVVLSVPETRKLEVKSSAVGDKIKVITRTEGINSPGDLNDQEKEELIHGGVVVHDERADDEKSKVYDVGMVESLSNPDESGLYEMIGKDGELYKVMIIQGPKTIGSGVANAYLVARLDGKGWAYMPKRDIFVRKNLSCDWTEFYNKLPSVTDMKENKRYTIVGSGADASLVFDVVEKDGNEYMVDVPYGCLHTSPCRRGISEERYPRRDQDFFTGARAKIDHDYPTVALKEEKNEDLKVDTKYKRYSVRPISVTDKVHYLKPIGDTLMAPARYKIFELEGNRDLGFVPGSITDAENILWKHASLKPVTIHSDGLGYHIETDSVSSRMTVDDVYRTLILTHGTTKSAAKMMIERADEKGHDAFLIKYAAVYRTAGGPLTPGPNAPPVSNLDNNMGYDSQLKAMITMPQVTYDPVGMPLGAYEDYNPEVLDKQTTQSVMRSAQQGNKEVLDTAVLSGMLKTMDSDSLIDKYLADLVTGEDRIGRMLFLFYWHNDKFVDRYGEDEIKELEDTLKNTFKGVGDLVLFLKKKSIEPDVANMGSDVDLSKLT